MPHTLNVDLFEIMDLGNLRNMLLKTHASILENTLVVENLDSLMDVSNTVRPSYLSLLVQMEFDCVVFTEVHSWMISLLCSFFST